MSEIETKDFRTFYANHFNITANESEAIIRIMRIEPDQYVNGLPNGVKHNLESQVIVNIAVLEELYRTIGTAISGLRKNNFN